MRVSRPSHPHPGRQPAGSCALREPCMRLCGQRRELTEINPARGGVRGQFLLAEEAEPVRLDYPWLGRVEMPFGLVECATARCRIAGLRIGRCLPLDEHRPRPRTGGVVGLIFRMSISAAMSSRWCSVRDSPGSRARQNVRPYGSRSRRPSIPAPRASTGGRSRRGRNRSATNHADGPLLARPKGRCPATLSQTARSARQVSDRTRQRRVGEAHDCRARRRVGGDQPAGRVGPGATAE